MGERWLPFTLPMGSGKNWTWFCSKTKAISDMATQWTPPPYRSRWQQRRRLDVSPNWIAIGGETRLLIDTARLAELLGVSVQQINTMRSAGRLPAPVWLASSIRWQVSAIRLWAAPIRHCVSDIARSYMRSQSKASHQQVGDRQPLNS
jgi:predicted DNA-binding transcriptional regulator AlpA